MLGNKGLHFDDFFFSSIVMRPVREVTGVDGLGPAPLGRDRDGDAHSRHLAQVAAGGDGHVHLWPSLGQHLSAWAPHLKV